MEYKPKLIRATDLRSVLNLLDKEEISYSYAATLLSEIAEQRLALLDVGGSFYCQRDIEGQTICDNQCKHCEEYYMPLKQ